MTDVKLEWTDQTTTISDAFLDPTKFKLSTLQKEIEAIPVTVNYGVYAEDAWGSWSSDTIHFGIGESYSAGMETNISNVVSAHVRKDYEQEKIKTYSGVTDANGEFAVTFDDEYLSVPGNIIQAFEVDNLTGTVPTESTTGLTVYVSRSVKTTLLGTEVVSGTEDADNESVTVHIINQDVP